MNILKAPTLQLVCVFVCVGKSWRTATGEKTTQLALNKQACTFSSSIIHQFRVLVCFQTFWMLLVLLVPVVEVIQWRSRSGFQCSDLITSCEIQRLQRRVYKDVRLRLSLVCVVNFKFFIFLLLANSSHFSL